MPGDQVYLVTVRREASGSDLFPLVSQSSNRRVSITYYSTLFPFLRALELEEESAAIAMSGGDWKGLSILH